MCGRVAYIRTLHKERARKRGRANTNSRLIKDKPRELMRGCNEMKAQVAAEKFTWMNHASRARARSFARPTLYCGRNKLYSRSARSFDRQNPYTRRSHGFQNLRDREPFFDSPVNIEKAFCAHSSEYLYCVPPTS